MTHRLMIAGELILATLTIVRVGAAGESKYDCQAVILKTPTPIAQFRASGHFQVRWGKTTLRADEDSLRLNGEELVPQPRTTRPPVGDVRVLTMQQIVARESEDVQLVAGSQEQVQYFKRESDDRFSLQAMLANPELELTLRIDAGSQPDTLHLTWNYKLVQIGKRTKIPGVSLDVGRPGIEEQSGHSEGYAQAGRYYLITLGQDDSGAGISVFLKITRSS